MNETHILTEKYIFKYSNYEWMIKYYENLILEPYLKKSCLSRIDEKRQEPKKSVLSLSKRLNKMMQRLKLFMAFLYWMGRSFLVGQ